MLDRGDRSRVGKFIVFCRASMTSAIFRPDRKKGFTLIELLIVMVIIGLIAALVGPRLFPKLGKGKQSAAKAQIELLGQALGPLALLLVGVTLAFSTVGPHFRAALRIALVKNAALPLVAACLLTE